MQSIRYLWITLDTSVQVSKVVLRSLYGTPHQPRGMVGHPYHALPHGVHMRTGCSGSGNVVLHYLSHVLPPLTHPLLLYSLLYSL